MTQTVCGLRSGHTGKCLTTVAPLRVRSERCIALGELPRERG